ncbi:hypothetical protein [Streptomyces hirsutus]|uniref:hypothetical protein n=1 Tax=Streptomyces hirsutus TaxID=35620 RepID=UPI000B072222|nr:hypothetical protein [Streptomyces hirsutus]
MASSAFGKRQRARIMITVKTYPELSNKYHETSCVAGIRLDQGTPRHVRLFPVPFRLLKEEDQFRKYSIIEVDVAPHGKQDSRPESLRPDLDTLKIVGEVPAGGDWKQRYKHVEPLVAPSLCAIKRDQEQRGTSLGVFRPIDVSFRLTPAEPWSASMAALANQLDLIEQDLAPLEWVPLDFRYRFRCADDACPTHDMALKDWEAGASYRKFLRTYGEQAVHDKLRQRWYDLAFASDRAVHFFVGNIAARPKTFMLLGLFRPKAHVVQYIQDSLFGD